MTAFLGGALLFAFSAVADIAPVLAHNTPEPPSTEDMARLEQYPDAKSLLSPQEGEQGITGLHELAESGVLGMLNPGIAAQLRPADLAIADKTGRRVAEQWIMSQRAQFANPAMKDLLYRYSDSLDAAAQLKLAALAADFKVFDLVGIGKLQPEHIIVPIILNIPAGSQGKTREIRTNLLLDTMRNRLLDQRMQALSGGLTSQQKTIAAQAVDEFGSTLGHYMAQDAVNNGDAGLQMLNEWKAYIQWTARDVTGVTPLQYLAARPDILSHVFSSEGRALFLAAVMDPGTQKVRESVILSLEILKQSDDVVRAVVTPDFLLSSPEGDGHSVASKIHPDGLVQYFIPRVMGQWPEAAIESVWAEVDERYKHEPAVRSAHRDLLRAVRGIAAAKEASAPLRQP